MSKDWKDCPFGAVYFYKGLNMSKGNVIKVSDPGSTLSFVFSIKLANRVQEMDMRGGEGCEEQNLNGFIPRQYLT